MYSAFLKNGGRASLLLIFPGFFLLEFLLKTIIPVCSNTKSKESSVKQKKALDSKNSSCLSRPDGVSLRLILDTLQYKTVSAYL